MDEVYKEYANVVYKYLYSVTHDADLSEELTQETFYRAVYSIDTYNETCKISVWLCQIAKHIWYQELAKRSKSKNVELDDNLQSHDASVENQIILSESKLSLFKFLHGMAEPTKEVMYLRLLGELSFKEIGEILRKSESWARVTFYRGKQKIVEGGYND